MLVGLKTQSLVELHNTNNSGTTNTKFSETKPYNS